MMALGLNALVGNAATTLGRQLLAGIVQLTTAVIIARVYGPEGNGQFTVALLFPMVLITFLNLGIGSANIYHIGSGKVGLSTALRTSARLWLVLGATGTVIGAVSIHFGAAELLPGVDVNLLWWSLGVFPVTLAQSYLISILQGLQRFRQFNIVLLVQPVVTLMLVAVITVADISGIEYVVATYITGLVAAIVVSMYYLASCKITGDEKSDEAGYFSSAISYGYKSNLSNILAYVNYKADIFLVNLLVGTSAAGIYIIAVQLAERLWMLSQSVSIILFPRLSQLDSDEEKRREITPIICRWVITLTFVGGVLLGVISFPLISILFGDAYLEAVEPLLFLLPGILAGSGTRILANDIAARGRPELNMYTAWVVVIINISGNIILIPSYGLAGAATATSIAYIVNLYLKLLIYGHFTGNRWRDSLFIKIGDVHSILAQINR
jgi:O-antigen/teichoic acid export membrane protein